MIEIPADKKAAVISALMDLAAVAGYPLKSEEMSFAGMKRDTGATYESLWFEDKETGTKRCLEFPYTGLYEDEKMNENMHEMLFDYILSKMAEQGRMESRKYDANQAAHQYVTINTIWNFHLSQNHPDKVDGSMSGPNELKISSCFPEYGVEVTPHRIIVQQVWPESIQMMKLPKLKELIEMPYCGNDQAQEDFENQFILSVETKGGRTNLKSFGSTKQVNRRPDTYPWHELHNIKKDLLIESVNVKYEAKTLDEGQKNFAIRTGKKIDEFYAKNGTPAEWYARETLKAA